MLVLTIAAVRLMGLWFLVAHTPVFVSAVYSAYAITQSVQMDALGSAPMIAVVISGVLPMLAGLFLLLFSAALSRTVVPVRAHDLPTPTSVSAKTVTQIGVFLIGLWLVGVGLPVVIALSMTMSPEGSMSFSSQHWLSVGLGIVLMLGSGLLAGFVAKLRSWP